MTRTVNRTPRADVYHIGKIIEANILPDGESHGQKLVKYKDGWDDQRVATIAGVTLLAVRGIRQDLFGHLRKGGHPDNLYKQFGTRIEALERRVQELEDQITKPSSVKTFSDLPKIINGPNRP